MSITDEQLEAAIAVYQGKSNGWLVSREGLRAVLEAKQSALIEPTDAVLRAGAIVINPTNDYSEKVMERYKRIAGFCLRDMITEAAGKTPSTAEYAARRKATNDTEQPK